MSSKASYLYREDSRGWGNNPRNTTSRDKLHSFLMRSVQPIIRPLAWDDVANFKGKNVWGVFNGTRQLLHVMSLAPEGKEGERWYVQPTRISSLNIFSISKADLELPNLTCKALMIVPPVSSAIVVYKGQLS